MALLLGVLPKHNVILVGPTERRKNLSDQTYRRFDKGPVREIGLLPVQARPGTLAPMWKILGARAGSHIQRRDVKTCAQFGSHLPRQIDKCVAELMAAM